MSPSNGSGSARIHSTDPYYDQTERPHFLSCLPRTPHALPPSLQDAFGEESLLGALPDILEALSQVNLPSCRLRVLTKCAPGGSARVRLRIASKTRSL